MALILSQLSMHFVKGAGGRECKVAEGVMFLLVFFSLNG